MMINNFNVASSIFASVYQGNMAMFNNRLNRNLFPPQSNMALQGFPQLDSGSALFVTNIRESASSMSAGLRQLSGAASSAGSITSGLDTDRNAVRNAVYDFVANYNSLFSAADENVNDPRAQNLATRLQNTSRAYTRGLSEVGITFDGSGRMRIDNERMNQALESGRLEQFFTENADRNFSFTNRLGQIADNVSRNPTNFATNSLFGGSLSGNFGYSSFGNLMQFNSLAAGSLMNFLL